MLNAAIVKNPINWLTIPTMALVGILLVSVLTSPFRSERKMNTSWTDFLGLRARVFDGGYFTKEVPAA